MSSNAHYPTGRDDLYLSHKQIATKLVTAIEDTPDVDDKGFYARGYNGWRDGLPAFSENYLRGFRQGLDHALRLIMASGGSSAAGLYDAEFGEGDELEEKVVEAAKQFCDHEPLSAKKQAGHRVGLHRAVAKLREHERNA